MHAVHAQGERQMTLQVAPEGLPPAGAPDSPSSDAEARVDTITAEHGSSADGETPALVERRHARARDELGNLFSDSDSSTTGSMSDTPAPVADTPLDSDATLSDEDGWMPQLGHNEPPVPRDDSMPAMLPAWTSPRCSWTWGRRLPRRRLPLQLRPPPRRRLYKQLQPFRTRATSIASAMPATAAAG